MNSVHGRFVSCVSLAELGTISSDVCFRAMGFLHVENPQITWTDLRGSPATSVRLIVGIRTPCRASSGGMFLASEIQRHSFPNEVLQCIFVDLVIFFDVDGTPDLPVKAGVEET